MGFHGYCADSGLGQPSGAIPSHPPSRSLVDWVLLDSLKGGSGESFDWRALRPPVEFCSSGWLLAGGLGPHNVAGALRALRGRSFGSRGLQEANGAGHGRVCAECMSSMPGQLQS